jgi:hypothetical protein
MSGDGLYVVQTAEIQTMMKLNVCTSASDLMRSAIAGAKLTEATENPVYVIGRGLAIESP